VQSKEAMRGRRKLIRVKERRNGWEGSLGRTDRVELDQVLWRGGTLSLERSREILKKGKRSLKREDVDSA